MLLRRLRRLLPGGEHILISRGAEIAAGVHATSDAVHRKERIRACIQAMGNPTQERIVEVVEFLDLWVILQTSRGWIPFPGWEGAPGQSRDVYPTRAEAVTAVARCGGELRAGRAQRVDRPHL